MTAAAAPVLALPPPPRAQRLMDPVPNRPELTLRDTVRPCQPVPLTLSAWCLVLAAGQVPRWRKGGEAVSGWAPVDGVIRISWIPRFFATILAAAVVP